MLLWFELGPFAYQATLRGVARAKLTYNSPLVPTHTRPRHLTPHFAAYKASRLAVCGRMWVTHFGNARTGLELCLTTADLKTVGMGVERPHTPFTAPSTRATGLTDWHTFAGVPGSALHAWLFRGYNHSLSQRD